LALKNKYKLFVVVVGFINEFDGDDGLFAFCGVEIEDEIDLLRMIGIELVRFSSF
jgi:hypothetical protein